MIVRTAKAKEPSFDLLEDRMIERCVGGKYFLARTNLKTALLTIQKESYNGSYVTVEVGVSYTGLESTYRIEHCANFVINEGGTQRGKKFIQIGCKRFVGEQRRKLIAWAKAAK
jgi:hypothetical protein